MKTGFGMFISYYVAMGVYNAKWVKCNLELRFGKNENLKIYRIKSEEGKGISDSEGPLN
jgi:hypothetical protein